MQNDLPTHYLAARDHLVRLAMTPGWWHYSRQRALELEEESVTHGHGLWPGMREAVRAELKRLGFKPRPSDLDLVEPSTATRRPSPP
ncbi:hypothetical protein, partial [Comamonas thiooxydans]|uniref:hypothetical protein n=1 Tax=Comamonas thiooxydans TaxID=363952 RepID=UPI00325FBAC0